MAAVSNHQIDFFPKIIYCNLLMCQCSTFSLQFRSEEASQKNWKIHIMHFRYFHPTRPAGRPDLCPSLILPPCKIIQKSVCLQLGAEWMQWASDVTAATRTINLTRAENHSSIAPATSSPIISAFVAALASHVYYRHAINKNSDA